MIGVNVLRVSRRLRSRVMDRRLGCRVVYHSWRGMVHRRIRCMVHDMVHDRSRHDVVHDMVHDRSRVRRSHVRVGHGVVARRTIGSAQRPRDYQHGWTAVIDGRQQRAIPRCFEDMLSLDRRQRDVTYPGNG